MKWTELDKEQQLACYESYLGDMLYEFGTTKKAMTFEEFSKEQEELC